ncbi:MAG: leucine-rich repeat protein [Clostridiales bacterium]|nr:leucine-rich repeat protein [Clostridiales bacterium]
MISITIPNNVTSIGYAVFDGCSSLESVNFATVLTEIPVRFVFLFY